MKNYVGRKCKGFRFEDGIDGVRWGSDMFDIIGQVGEVVTQGEDHVTLKFNNNRSWCFPISLIEPHLIPETPEIPQLGEGIEMQVSDDGIEWVKRNVIAKKHDGLYITGHNNFWAWKYARPIQEVKKYTKEELVEIVGHDFEIV
jgi:hypothetical protein